MKTDVIHMKQQFVSKDARLVKTCGYQVKTAGYYVCFYSPQVLIICRQYSPSGIVRRDPAAGYSDGLYCFFHILVVIVSSPYPKNEN